MAPLKFDWDKGNISKSVDKHAITNAEAESTFKDPQKKISISNRFEEVRYICIGKSLLDKILTSYFIVRNGKVRIIGTRISRKEERARYEKE